MKTKLSFSAIARVIGAILLFLALSRHTYGYYSLLRWVTCAIAVYLAFTSYSIKKVPWTWLFAFIALLFNPISPIRLDRQTWAYLDVATAIVFFISIYFVREDATAHNSNKNVK